MGIKYFCGLWYYARINQSCVNFFLYSFIAFFLCQLCFSSLRGDRQSVSPPIWSHVHSYRVGYHLCPAAIPVVWSLSKHHHQFLHLLATIQCLHRSCAASVSIAPSLHRWQLPLQRISAIAVVSKYPKHVLLQINAAIYLPIFSASSVHLVSSLILYLM